MVNTCCAFNCSQKAGKGYSFHKFPEDNQLRAAWCLALRRKNFNPTKHSKVCSKHFSLQSFAKERFGFPTLKKDAVPTIFDFPSHVGPMKTDKNPPLDLSDSDVSSIPENVGNELLLPSIPQNVKNELILPSIPENGLLLSSIPENAKNEHVLSSIKVENELLLSPIPEKFGNELLLPSIPQNVKNELILPSIPENGLLLSSIPENAKNEHVLSSIKVENELLLSPIPEKFGNELLLPSIPQNVKNELILPSIPENGLLLSSIPENAKNEHVLSSIKVENELLLSSIPEKVGSELLPSCNQQVAYTATSTSNCLKKRKIYVGDFERSDMDSPTKSQKFYNVAFAKVVSQQRRIKQLTRKNHTLRKKIDSLKTVIDSLEEEGLISDEAAIKLKRIL